MTGALDGCYNYGMERGLVASLSLLQRMTKIVTSSMNEGQSYGVEFSSTSLQHKLVEGSSLTVHY